MAGKSINLFLMDGDPNGRIKCTLANWTGVAYKIPRTMLDEARNIDALKQTGVYLLFGADPTTDEPVVYIGQAAARKNGLGILNRWEEHKRDTDKDWWNEAVALTTRDNSFGQTEISYLENRFRNMALEAGRYQVMNGNDPALVCGAIENARSMVFPFIKNRPKFMRLCDLRHFRTRCPWAVLQRSYTCATVPKTCHDAEQKWRQTCRCGSLLDGRDPCS